MTLALQIAIGIWFGGLFLIGSVAGYCATAEWLKKSDAARPLRLWWNA